MTYAELIIANKEKILIEFKKIIDNKTLESTYIISTNLHCDFGICDTMMKSFCSSSKSRFNKRIAEFKKLTGFKPRLVKTDNDAIYTRLVYKLMKVDKA